MNYIDYLKKKFSIKKISEETIQNILEKEYVVKFYLIGVYQTMSFEMLIENLKLFKISEMSISMLYKSIQIMLDPVYLINIETNNVSKEELFYILYILYSKFQKTMSKENINFITKEYYRKEV